MFSTKLIVHSADNLPKADTFGKIDPFVVIRSSTAVYKTHHLEKNYNPVWNYETVIKMKQGDPIIFEVWDKDSVGSDEKVAEAKFVFEAQMVRNVAIPLTCLPGFKPHESSRVSSITISVASFRDFDGLGAFLHGTPGLLVHDRTYYLPLPYDAVHFPVNGVYFAIEYEKGDTRTDLFLFETQNVHSQGVEVTFGLQPSTNPLEHYTTKRKTHNTPQKRGPLMIYAESKLDDLDPSTPFQDIIIFSAVANKVWTSDVDKIVTQLGWRGVMNYQQAKKALKGCFHDDKKESIYINLPYGNLMIDFDEGNCDFVFGLYDDEYKKNMIADATHSSTPKRKHKIFLRPKPAPGSGNRLVQMQAHLDDLPTPVYFNQLILSVIQYSNIRTVNLLQILPRLKC